jgi:3'-phosphoadenosine 5'-phosphosulfate sulfotransferase (PAPS reductase)/FAD synthetase
MSTLPVVLFTSQDVIYSPWTNSRRMSRKYVLSYGGGINTTALMILLVRKRMPFDEAVFADTGGELPETYKNVKVARRYLKRHGIPLRVVRSKNGTLFETCKKRRVIPSQLWRWSTRDYKITPIHAYYRSLNSNIHEYLGIAYDEIERIKPSFAPNVTSSFPLVDEKMTREDCVRMIREAGLPVPPKSGCYFCPFNSEDRWKYIWQNHRELYSKAMGLEESSKHFPRQKLQRLTLRVLRHDFRRAGNHNASPENPCGAYCMT